MRSYIHKYHNVRFAQVVKALVCAMCLWSIVQTACADEFKVNETLNCQLQTKQVKVSESSATCVIPVIDIIGSPTTKYCRLVLFDVKTQKPLYELSKTYFSYDTSKNWLFQQTDYGLIEFPRWTATRYPINVTLTKPTGYEWTDLYVGMYICDVSSSSTDEKEKTKQLGIEGNIDVGSNTSLHPSITSDPNQWTNFCRFIFFTSTKERDYKHYYIPNRGITQSDLEYAKTSVDGETLTRQKTNVWEYTYYVKRQANNEVTLKAPIVEGEILEYAAYWRWYDNKTFRDNDRISQPSIDIWEWTTVGRKNLLSRDYKDEKNRSIGLTYASTTYTKPYYKNMASVVYTLPSNVDSWTGDDIAADASRYTDFGDVNNKYWSEPTLSMRYIFHVRPAKEIADKIKEAIMNVGVYENHGSRVFPLKKDATTAEGYSKTAKNTLRLNMRGIGNYWFYPFASSNILNQPSPEQFSSTVTQCKSISWVVLVSIDGQLYYKNLGSDSMLRTTSRDTEYAMYDLVPSNFEGTYYSVSDKTKTHTMSKLETGRRYTVMAYANNYTSTENSTDGVPNSSSPIARFDCYYVWDSEPELEIALSEHRQTEKLEESYTRIGWISFDDLPGMNYNIPTVLYDYGSSYNNHYDGALDWDKTYYGAVYPQLIKSGFSITGYKRKYYEYSPLHGDYFLVKSANLPKVSPHGESSQNSYYWWYGTSPTLYDRTYERSGGRRSGYFLYVDASDEPRPTATLDFEARLCAGATLMFTVDVANLTASDAEFPQLLFKLYGYKTDNEGNVVKKELIQSFATGEFKSYGAKDLGVWYQVFAKTFVHQGLSVNEFTRYNVTIENACRSTGGADYAIDDIRFYVANDQIEVIQTSEAEEYCSKKDNGAYLKLRVDYNMIKSVLNVTERTKPLYYRICKENGEVYNTTYPSKKDNPTKYPNHDSGSDDKGNKYGMVWINAEDSQNTTITETDPFGYLNLVLADVFFPLDPTQKYYVSVALPTVIGYYKDGSPQYGPGTWGTPSDPCSIYSKPINISFSNIKITSNTGSTSMTYSTECGKDQIDVNLNVKLHVPDPQYGIYKDIPWNFDFVIGSEKAFENARKTDNLLQAIEHFRAEYPNATGLDTPTQTPQKGTFTDEEYEVLKKYTSQSRDEIPDPAVSDALIVKLTKSDSYAATLTMKAKTDVNANFYFIAVPGKYDDPKTKQKYTICSSLLTQKATFTYESPFLRLGNPKVSYPDAWNNSAKEFRLGLAQANALQTDTRLRIPINAYRDADFKNNTHDFGGTSRNRLIFEQRDANKNPVMGCVRLVATNDPTIDKSLLQVATVDGAAWGAKVGEVANEGYLLLPTDRALIIDFSKNQETFTAADGTQTTVNGKIAFHEGYSYTFALVYRDVTRDPDVAGNAVCFGTTNFTLNIVPEYVTWTGGNSTNTNWNNDANWARSTKADLRKEGVGKSVDDYKDYGDAESPLLRSAAGNDPSLTPQIYVPMRFTKVIIRPNTTTPQLGSYATDQSQGILSAESLLNPMLSEPTQYINYNLMLKTTPTIEGGIKYFDCENFYANMCQEVYFASANPVNLEAKAQLRNQHYLSYQQAWVDLALPVNRWSMFSVPLHNVYAGDFYLPYATGKQETEAFQPITFGDGSKDYNRAKYYVYQRTWYKTDPQVVAADGYDYSAQVNYDAANEDVEYVTSEWSHPFNDMKQAYARGMGYSLYPEPKEATADASVALFRLPKADTSFDYYDHTGNKKNPQSTGLDRSLNGLLLTNNSKTDNPMKLNGVIEVTPEETQQRNGYFLVGNPYMASIDMKLFLQDNPQLFEKYWIVDNGTLRAFGKDESFGLGRVAPMQAFFVKATTGALLTNIVFNPSQCAILFNTGKTKLNRRNTAITLHASNAKGQSMARVLTHEEANNDFDDREDVEVIFDKDLTSAPQVYTVSGNCAAAINHLTSLRNVPLGVEATTDDDVQFSVSGTALLPEPLYLFDAKTNQHTLLTDSVRVMLSPNSVGRYFLTSNMEEATSVQTDLRCYSVHAGKVVAATTEADNITSVEVFDFMGRFLRSYTPHQSVYTFDMPQGVYLITLSSEKVPEGRTFKVIVR